MKSRVILALRVVVAVALVGSVLVQSVLGTLLWLDLRQTPAMFAAAILVIFVGGIACLQAIGVCVWILLGFVRKGTVFSSASLRYVNIIIGAIGAGSFLVFSFGVTVANLPDEDMAPGMVLLIGGAAFVGGGVALVVYVMRQLLEQAIDFSRTASRLQSELDEVI